jgi:integrase
MLDEAGLSARVIADQLGHARPSMTQDVYMGRKVVDARVAEALEEDQAQVRVQPKRVNKR